MKKIKYYFTLLSFVFCIENYHSQDSLFVKTVGSPNGNEEFEAIIPTINTTGNIAVGLSDSYGVNGDSDGIVIEFDKNGNIVWSKTYGDTADNMLLDIVRSVDQTYVVGGWIITPSGDYDFWVLKIDTQGNVLWEKQFGGNGDEQVWSVVPYSNGYFFVGGTTSFGAGMSDILVIKTDLSGNILWQKVYGTAGDDAPPGNYDEYVARADLDANGDLILSGNTDGTGHGASDIYLIKIDANSGNIIWQYVYGDVDEESTWNFTIDKITNTYYVAGNTVNPITFEADLWLIKVNDSGALIGQKTFGISGVWDEALNLSATDNGVLIASYFENNPNDWEASILWVDSNLQLQTSKTIQVGNLDWTNDAILLNDSNILMIGVTTNTSTWDEDLLYVKTNLSGNIANCNYITNFMPTINSTSNAPLNANFSVQNTSIQILAGSNLSQDITPQLTTYCSEEILSAEEMNQTSVVSIYPNPVNNKLFFNFNTSGSYNIEIFSMLGQKVYEKKDVSNYFSINLIDWKKGVYMIRLINQVNEVVSTKRIIKH